MYASGKFKAIVFVVLVSGLSAKLLLLGSWDFRAPSASEEVRDLNEIAAFFKRHHFSAITPEADEDFKYLQAVSGGCRIVALLISAEGWQRDSVKRIARGDDQVVFEYNGTLYRDQPIRLTWLYFQARRLLNDAGVTIPSRPILGLVTSGICPLRDLPWVEVAYGVSN